MGVVGSSKKIVVVQVEAGAGLKGKGKFKRRDLSAEVTNCFSYLPDNLSLFRKFIKNYKFYKYQTFSD